MATITLTEIQKQYDQVVNFKKEITEAGNDKRGLLSGIDFPAVETKLKLPSGVTAIDAANWDAMTDTEKQEAAGLVASLRDSLQRIAGLNGPTEPGHIMNDSYAPNWAILLMTFIALLSVSLLLYGIMDRWTMATGTDYTSKIQAASTALTLKKVYTEKIAGMQARAFKGADTSAAAKAAKTAMTPPQLKLLRDSITSMSDIEKEAGNKAGTACIEACNAIGHGGASEETVLIMVIMLGALGGALHSLGSLVKYIGNRQFKQSWVLYYFAMPFTGAGLAPLVYMLMRIGILSPSGGAGEGTSISNLNLMAIYAFAALSGLFAKTATEKLAEVFNTMFKTATPTKDAIGPDVKAPGK